VSAAATQEHLERTGTVADAASGVVMDHHSNRITLDSSLTSPSSDSSPRRKKRKKSVERLTQIQHEEVSDSLLC